MKKKYSIFKNYLYLFKNLWEYDYKFVLLVILEIITNAVQPFVLVLLPPMIIRLLEMKCSIPTLISSCLLAFILAGLVQALAIYLQNRNRWFFIFVRLEKFWIKIVNKAMDMDYAIYEQEETQNEMSKACGAVNNNSDGIEGFYHQNTLLLTSILGLVIYSCIISSIHPVIVLFLIGLSSIQYFFHTIAKKYEDKHYDDVGLYYRNQLHLFKNAYDIKSGKDIRLYQLQNWLTSIFESFNKKNQALMSKIQSLYYLYDFSGLALQFVRDILCYGYLIYLLIKGMGISDFVLYLGIVRGFGDWITQIGESIAKIMRCNEEVNHFREFVGKENIYSHNEGKTLQLNENESFDIVFNDVTFTYPNSDKKVLDHISFHINSREKIALVGVNGAGKTTLVKMLCGFYKPTSGRILINGIDINELDIEKYFNQVSVLFQDSILLSFSIAQNITGKPERDINVERLTEVLKISDLYDKIKTLPKEVNTYLGKDVEEDGIQLSGGQIQKLFLARALYKDAPMIILDEPTAALDAIAESEMYQKYADLVENKTSIFISHRLSSTRFCDRILFLENGKIKEDGSHDELMELNGAYANMFNIQSQYYVEGGNSDETK